MASYNLIMNQIDLDEEFYVWGSGQDLRRFNGDSWDYYDYTNSAVPSGAPYFLDTRCISIDTEDKAWLGCAQGPTAGLNEVAVFWVDTNDVSSGRSWNFSDLGVFDVPQEISLVYSCPFGDDILAFCTPLNGIGGTGTTGYTEINNVAKGRLFYYLKETDQWKEKVPGYIWPHIYDIKAKGLDGKNYLYYIGTDEGLFVVPSGISETVDLAGGGKIIKQARVYNTNTSSIINDKVYSIDLDEAGNAWLGTAGGLSYFDGDTFYLNLFVGGPVAKVKSRPNGHVFFSKGDGELNQGGGLGYSNGKSYGYITSSTSNLPNNNVLDIKLIKHNVKQKNITVYENSLWVLCYNDIAVFNYDQPHVYGSSKYAGTTGWNFTYLAATGSVLLTAPVPKVNKYTWSYPEYRVYQDEYLEYRFPGLDSRNLFLTTKLVDIADGKAGKQEYWDNWPIESSEDVDLKNTILPPDFSYTINKLYGNSDSINITCSTSIKTASGTKYYIGGSLIGSSAYFFGSYGGTNYYAAKYSINPTLGGRPSYTAVGQSSTDPGETAFIACYDEKGKLESYLPFRGYQTRLDDIAPSEDGTYIVASGTYNRYIEEGPYVWASFSSEVTDVYSGPTGAPVGLTTSDVPGGTADYPWIYGSSGAYLIDNWEYDEDNGSPSNGYFSFPSGTQNSFDVAVIYVNYDAQGGDNTAVMQTSVTGNVIGITLSPFFTEAFYRIDSITYSSPGVNTYGITWVSGYSGIWEGYYGIGTVFGINFYDYGNNSFPMVRDLIARNDYYNLTGFSPVGVFVAKIGKDLGSTISLTNLNDEETKQKKYRGLAFRNFGSAWNNSGFVDYPAGYKTKVDLTRYSINVGITYTNDFAIIGPQPGGLSTFKNLWGRHQDYTQTSDLVCESTQDVASNFFTDDTIGYVRMSTDDMTLLATTTAASQYPDPFSENLTNRTISSLSSLPNDNTTMITGLTRFNFTFGGIYMKPPDDSDYVNVLGNTISLPYYAILDKNGVGVTGGILAMPGATALNASPQSIVGTKDKSSYYVTSLGAGAGTYFGNTFDVIDNPDPTYGDIGYYLTAQLTEQGVDKSFFYSPGGFIFGDGAIRLHKAQVVMDQYILTHGFESFISANSNLLANVMKTSMVGKVLSNASFGNALLDPGLYFTNSTDVDGNIIMFGYNSSSLRAGSGYYTTGTNKGFVLRSKKHESKIGINLGNIISRPGSGAWTWCDVHSTDSGMQIPLMSTVVFNNYASNLYGKENNVWVLSNSVTGEELLDVKGTPYFIYTFTSPGNFTIYNSVEDSEGNVYTTSKIGYIEVINHKVKKDLDPNPDYVDSFDYGEPLVFPGRDYQAYKLAKDLEKAQAQIYSDNQVPFGTEFKVIHNPDATFRTDI